MNALALLPGFTTRRTAPADSGLAPKPPNPPKPPPSLGALGGLGDSPKSESAIAAEGDDPEREAIMGEEAALPTLRVQPLTFTTGLLRAASPLAGVPGARPCPTCGRGVWVSPSWRGPVPTVCRSCETENVL